MNVIVIGGGWAGMAAAVELARHNIPVTVLEVAKQVGGRARSISRLGMRFDNGQHLLLGAYRETLRLLQVMDIPEERVFLRQPLGLHLRGPAGEVSLTTPRLPHPLQLIYALLNIRGLSLAERTAALRLCMSLRRELARSQDISVTQWLRDHGQPQRVIESLWHPLCLASLNTPVEQASAQIFRRVLHDAFLQNRRDSDMLIPLQELGACFPEPAARYITRHGGRVLCATRALALQLKAGRIRGVATAQADQAADHVIIALPPLACLRLISAHPEFAELAHRLAMFGHEATCTLYLRYPEDTHLDNIMLGMLGTTAQWLFDLAHTGKKGWMAAVISGTGPHLALDNDALMKIVAAEVAQLMPYWPAPLDGFVIREKQATFSCRPGINAIRPEAQTAVRGCWLAGDYTATGYPATLEGAVISGVRAAQALMASNRC